MQIFLPLRKQNLETMHKITLLIFLLGAALTTQAASPTDLTNVKRHFAKALVPSDSDPYQLMKALTAIAPEQEMSDQAVVELHQRYPLDVKKLERYLSTLSAEGAWPDIDYRDQKRSGWEPKNHPERILELAKLYLSPQTAYYHSSQVETAIHRAIGYWFSAKLTCPNWWYNQIGVPKTLGSAFVLFEDRLTPDEKRQAIETMQASQFGMTGQNKVWLAGNVLMRALLQDDAALARQARDTIASEIVTGGKEGIKDDWSFHQHGAQQQFGNYGLSFVSSMSFYSQIFAGTPLAFTETQLNTVRRLIDEGYRWILWKGKMDISSLGRQLFHNAPVHKALSLAFSAGELGGEHPGACAVTARQLTDENYTATTAAHPLCGHKHFWLSDYTVHRNAEWMASVKMASSRVTGAESMNGDNMKGYYMADGATYVYRTGNEYLNIFPLWDWRRVPGVTAFLSDAPMPTLKHGYSPGNDADFAGGVSDGHRGMTAMTIDRSGIRAHKAWVMTDRFVLCLGAGIQADSSLTVSTSVEQCFRQGELKALQGKTWTAVDSKRTFKGKEQRFFHHGTGYIVWNATNGCTAETSHRKGQWHDIMQMYSPQDVEGDVVSIDCPQGLSPRNGTYQYLILPSVTEEETRDFRLSDLRVLRNDAEAQAVYAQAQNTWWITAYRPLTLKLNGGRKLEILTPGVYQIQRSEDRYLIHASDPTWKSDTLRLRIDKKDLSIPVSGKQGQSVSATL